LLKNNTKKLKTIAVRIQQSPLKNKKTDSKPRIGTIIAHSRQVSRLAQTGIWTLENENGSLFFEQVSITLL
jgi:hypothetical protein